LVRWLSSSPVLLAQGQKFVIVQGLLVQQLVEEDLSRPR
uniref:Transposase n=1 Tax=Brugia timori TaxID=42155 RepID=A0A0R3RCM8_9BILA